MSAGDRMWSEALFSTMCQARLALGTLAGQFQHLGCNATLHGYPFSVCRNPLAQPGSVAATNEWFRVRSLSTTDRQAINRRLSDLRSG